MVAELSIDHASWLECIESSGEECFKSSVSAKNVERVLGTASMRGPQKKLCTAVLPFVSSMLQSASGVSILTSLVKYGTPKTVELIGKSILAADEKSWSFKSDVEKDLAAPLSSLLDSIVYREDATGESTKTIVQNLVSCPGSRCCGSVFTLLATGRLFSLNTSFAKQMMKDKSYKKALLESSSSPQMKTSVVGFCERVLVDNSQATGSDFLFDVYAESMKGSHKVWEEVMYTLAAKADSRTVDKICSIMSNWSDIHALGERDGHAKVISEVLGRSTDAAAKVKLASKVVKKMEDIDSRLASRKTPQLKLLSVMSESPQILNSLQKSLGASVPGKLKAAKVRFTGATKSKSVATQDRIKEKLMMLGQNSTAAKSKRPRED